MPIEKIWNIADMISAGTKTRTSAGRHPDPQKEIVQSDVVSIGNSEGEGNAEKIQWPPLFPIGDAQCIFKVEK